MTMIDWAPSVDIAETAEEYQIKAELPEVKKEDVKVSVDRGVLRIEGERKHEKEEKGKKWHRVERSYGSFLRTFTVPDNADSTNVSAEFENGLSVRLPKSPNAKPKASKSRSPEGGAPRIVRSERAGQHLRDHVSRLGLSAPARA